MQRYYPILLAIVLASCVPGVAEYTKTEAPTALQVDGGRRVVPIAFARRSDRLTAGQLHNLTRLVRDGEIRPADRVEIAATGGGGLAAARFAAISRVLLPYGIVATARPPLAGPRPDQAVLVIGHYAVTLPPCPNWSQPPAGDFTNEPASNFGCANAVNLGLMAASPGDLAGGRPAVGAAGQPAVTAVERYLTDNITPLVAAEVGPIAAPTGSQAPPPPASQ